MTEMTVDALIASLTQVEKAATGRADQNPRAGLRHAIKFLDKHRGATVDIMVKELRANKPPKPSKPPTESVRLNVVNLHLEALRRAGTNKSEFDLAFENLKGDTKARLPEVKQIVRDYAGDKSSFRSKPVGYGILEQAFDDRWKLANR